MNEREEIQRLNEEIGMLGKQNTELRQIIETLRGELADAKQLIATLEDGKKEAPHFVKRNKAKPEGPKKARRKRAAKHNRGRKRSQSITHREEHRVESCPECKCKLRKKQVAWRREVIDLPPPVQVEVTEHAIYKGYCPRCEEWRYASEWSQGEVIGQRRLGTRVTALIGYLSETLRMPYHAIKSYLKTLHGLEISEGAIADIRRGLAKKLEPMVDELKAQMQSSAIVYADETGWRENGQNGYIWSFSTEGKQAIRYYHFDHSRAQHVVEGILAEAFQGVLVSDFYGGYNVYRGLHQRCWVHLLRTLHKHKEDHAQDETVQEWALKLRSLYDRGESFIEEGAHSQEEREAIYHTLWIEAERLGLLYAYEKHPCRALAERVLRHQDELFQFVRVAGLAADNNLAERSVRPLVIIRKISGGTRSSQGSQTRMLLASVFATLQARGIEPFQGCLSLIQTNS